MKHGPVGAVCDGEDVGWHFVTFLAFVHLNHLLRVDGQPAVRVDHHAEEARVRLEGKEIEHNTLDLDATHKIRHKTQH